MDVRTTIEPTTTDVLPLSPQEPRRFRMIDYTFEVRTNLSVLRGVLDRLLAPFARDRSDGPAAIYDARRTDDPLDQRGFELRRDGEPIGRVSSIGLLVDRLVREATIEAVSSTTGCVAVHAAAAASDGRAVVMPAPAGHGKTTTVAALVQAGWDFLTDEAALFSLEDGLVHPFPRPLSISPGSMKLLPGLGSRIPPMGEWYRLYDHHVSAADLRPGCLSPPAAPALVVFPTYAMGAATTLTRASQSEALVELLKRSFNLDLLGRDAVRTLAEVVAVAPCYRLSIGSLSAAVEAIQGAFAGDG